MQIEMEIDITLPKHKMPTKYLIVYSHSKFKQTNE